MKKVVIMGAGAWGTALALSLNRAKCDVKLWPHRLEMVEHINKTHDVPTLKNVKIPAEIKATQDPDDLQKAHLIFLVSPSQQMKEVCQLIKPHLKPNTPLIICSKGINQENGWLMSEIVTSEIPNSFVCVMSGPSFAVEVAQDIPTAVTFACKDLERGTELIKIISSPNFRPYLTNDLMGVEIGGAVKNVLAIASGIIEGKNLGRNPQAALITRGLAEMMRLTLALGGQKETVMGLSGLGDLILTANSPKSRNYSLGISLGQGKSLKEIMGDMTAVAEGIYTAPAIMKLAEKHGVDMPICGAVDQVLHHGASISKTMQDLLSRPLKTEF